MKVKLLEDIIDSNENCGHDVEIASKGEELEVLTYTNHTFLLSKPNVYGAYCFKVHESKVEVI